MRSSFNPRRPKEEFRLSLHLPLNAVTVTHLSSDVNRAPSSIYISGVLVVKNINCDESRTFRGTRVTLRSCSTLDLGEGRGAETDIFAEQTIVHPSHRDVDREKRPKVADDGGEDEPLGVGGWRERFDIEIPATDDAVPGANVTHYIIVQHLGQNPDPTPRPPHLTVAELDAHNHHSPFPPPPMHPPLQNTITAIRKINVIHDPSPLGKVNELDLLCRPMVRELGIVDLHCTASPFTVAGPMILKVELPHPSSRTALFSVTAFVQQKQRLKSPRDGTEVCSSRIVPFASVGSIPHGSQPGLSEPALWRGPGAGGKDIEPLSTTIYGRFPHSSDSRESTLKAVVSPVTLDHSIVFQVLFSVHGQKSDGTPIEGDGELCRLRISRDVVFPSCRLAPMASQPPLYQQERMTSSNAYPFNTNSDLARSYVNQPCSSCRKLPLENLCRDCKSSTVPHVRHDPDWTRLCHVCSHSYLETKGDPDHVSIGFCACVEWMRWKVSAPGRQQSSFASAAGLSTGKQIEEDQLLATKLESEETSRGLAKGSS